MSWWIFLAKTSLFFIFIFFCQIPSILSIQFLFFFEDQLVMAKTQSMVFENVCWQHVKMEPKNLVTQDLVQVLMTA